MPPQRHRTGRERREADGSATAVNAVDKEVCARKEGLLTTEPDLGQVVLGGMRGRRREVECECEESRFGLRQYPGIEHLDSLSLSPGTNITLQITASALILLLSTSSVHADCQRDSQTFLFFRYE